MALDVATIRHDFPIFSHFAEKNLVYLDSAATSLKPASVLEAMREYYEEYSTNVHRGIYALSERATQSYEDARSTVARFIGARRPEEVVFTRNATEALNLIAFRYAGGFLAEGDGILLTEMEHHSNLVPWQFVARAKKLRLHFLPFEGIGGELLWSRESFRHFLKERNIKLVSITHVSNVFGTINPLEAMIRKIHEAEVPVVVDASQSVPHLPMNVADLGADFLVFSGHKMLGPTGIGVLWGRHELLAKMPPFLTGGEMVVDVRLDESQFQDPPHRFEAGTPNIAGAIGLAAAVRYLENAGMEAVREHEKELLYYTLSELSRIRGIQILGPREIEQRSGVVSFLLEGIHAHDVASFLDEQGVMIRSGDQCAKPLHKKLRVPASSRISVYLYNTASDIDRAVAALREAVGTLNPKL